jgi:hypothetical protein
VSHSIQVLSLIGILYAPTLLLADEHPGATFAFGDGYLSATFSAQALTGDYGRETTDGRAADISNKIQLGCFASTPPIPILSDAMVDVAVTYDAQWQGFGRPHEIAKEPAFFTEMGSDDATGSHYFQGAVMVGDLGRISEILPPKPPTNLGYYNVETARTKVFSQVNIPVVTFTKAFHASVCHLNAGSTALIRQIQVKIRHGDNALFVPATTYENGSTPTDNLIVCSLDTPVATGCHLAPRELLGPQASQTEFRVRYSYSCTGAPLHIVLRTELAERSLERSLAPQELAITGKDYLRIEMKDPARANASYVLPGCALNILSVEATPSSATLDRWAEDARVFAESLEDKLALWRQARSIERILNWDDEQLQALKPGFERSIDSYLREQGSSLEACGGSSAIVRSDAPKPPEWYRAVDAHSEMIDYITLLQYVEGTIQGRPEVLTPYQISEAAARLRQPLVTYYRGQLMQKYQEARRFQARLRAARQETNQDLDAALAEVAEQVQRTPA